MEVGGDQHALEVLDAVREHFNGRGNDEAMSTVIHGDDRPYSQHDR